ncbi:MAG: hypothetical protein ACOX1F_06560 [Erysipelotrichaceae bacterium]|jgi:hypothetical protein
MEKRVTLKQRFDNFIFYFGYFIWTYLIYYYYNNTSEENFLSVLKDAVRYLGIFTSVALLFVLGNYYLYRKEYNQQFKEWLNKKFKKNKAEEVDE